MSKVMDRMNEIVSSLPQDYFDKMNEYEIVGSLINLYLNKYGEDETTIVPGTDKHLNYEFLHELLNKNSNQGG